MQLADVIRLMMNHPYVTIAGSGVGSLAGVLTLAHLTGATGPAPRRLPPGSFDPPREQDPGGSACSHALCDEVGRRDPAPYVLTRVG